MLCKDDTPVTMRTSDLVSQSAATAGLGSGLLTFGGALTTTATNGKGTPVTGGPASPVISFDFAAYTQLIQQMASKMYPYDPAALAASLAALSPVSHLPLALTAPHALSLATKSSAAAAAAAAAAATASVSGDSKTSIIVKEEIPSPTSSPSSTTPIATVPTPITTPTESSVKSSTWQNIKISPKPTSAPRTGKEEETETALDLRTQGLKSLYSSYRRASLDDIKPKIVEDIWIENDIRLTWTDSKVVAYNPAQKLFMCVDCECVGFLSRVAEHWLGAHANLRVFSCPRCPYTSAWSRCVKMHLTRQHNEQFADTTMWKENSTLMEVTRLMQELRNKVENRIDSTNALSDKRFYCPHCPYATDRRDLYTRHENIHKDDKPFHCYICFKQFNRADHVKKHFVRMHPETEYEISKIRKQPGTGRVASRAPTSPIASLPVETVQKDHSKPIKSEQTPTPPIIVVPPVPSPPTATPALTMSETATPPSTNMPTLAEEVCKPLSPATNNPIVGGVGPISVGSSVRETGLINVGLNLSAINATNDSSDVGRGRRRGERAYTCPYCQWSGSDNWCLKRHMNTHIKPFACVMCDYKAARAERLSTHVWKVHNKRICNKCNFLADTQELLLEHTREEHHNNPYSRRYICSSCGLTFDTRPALETHQHLSHPRLSQNTTNGNISLSLEIQDAPHDLSMKSESKSAEVSPVTSPLVCPVDSCGQILGSAGALAEHVRIDHEGNGASCCPHCGYQLTHDELSRDHWLTHHKDVCAACVHVFTAVYGPQLWKKVHVRHPPVESPLDAIVTGLSRKRIVNDSVTPPPFPVVAVAPTVVPEQLTPVDSRETPSPNSDAQDTDSERFSKRSRKQSCPKKVITVAEEGTNGSNTSNALRKKKSLKIRRRSKSGRSGLGHRQCRRCPRRPIFASRARLIMHLRWAHRGAKQSSVLANNISTTNAKSVDH